MLTAKDMYMAFLDGIKKERISTVPPPYFNRIINEAYTLWYREKSVQIEIDQKRIDDLQGLRVVTDGLMKIGGITLNPIPAVNQENNGEFGVNIFQLPMSVEDSIINDVIYPVYRRFLNVAFRVKYYGDPCYEDGTLSGWKNGYIMRSNQRMVVKRNPFRRASKNRIYFEIIDNYVRIETGGTSIGYDMRLEYIKYPDTIHFSTEVEECVNCELQSDQQREIVDVAIRMYIERVSDPRYQTQLYEQTQRAVGK